MPLTARAATFLERQQWRADAVKSVDIIERAFRKTGRQPSNALLDFQLRYGGLMIYVGLEPICFGILHGELARGDFRAEKKHHALISWEPDEDCPGWQFTCADTLYQELFTLDEHGHYYEGHQLCASSFEVILEDLAVFEELHLQGYQKIYSRYAENLHLPVEALASRLQLQPYPGFTPDVIYWGHNDRMVVRRNVDEMKVFAKEPLDQNAKAAFDALVNEYNVGPTPLEAKSSPLQPAGELSLLMRLLRWLNR